MDTYPEFANPIARRQWLLSNALQSHPLDKALEIAREAEQFLAGEAPVAAILQAAKSVPVARSEPPPYLVQPMPPAPVAASKHDPSTRVVEEENQDIVEGPPIESTSPLAETNAPVPDQTVITASLDDVVRYLRRRDDIVVAKGSGLFVVNGRFHIQSDELVARANRMRDRDGQPAFQV
jgi:hypothetical protein